jgi:hypothetical protein
MLIKQSEAARILGVSRQYIGKLAKEKKPPGFIVYPEEGKPFLVNTEHPDWQRKITSLKKHTPEDKKKSNKGKSKSKAVKQILEAIASGGELDSGQAGGLQADLQETEKKYNSANIPTEFQELADLNLEAEIAERKKAISNAKIFEQKAMQEEIKTAQIKKELAPIDLVKHFFSFSENMIQRIYRRPHEISPQIEALYMGKEPRKAVQLIIREIESIIKDTQKELIKAIEDEEFDIKKLNKGGK